MDTEDREIEREKLAIEKQKLEVELMKARWTAVSVIIPVLIAAATIAYGMWIQKRTAQDNLVAKAIEIVMKAEDPDPTVVRGKAEQMRQLLPDALPKDFAKTFSYDQNAVPSPASQIQLLNLIIANPLRRNEIIDMWIKLWPDDSKWALQLRGDLSHTKLPNKAPGRNGASLPRTR